MTCYPFGPVPSRRLGRSLGVDLVPFKTCSYDCIYCQLGPTTCKTIERKAWVPLEQVVAELPQRLASKPDYITLSGSGEPTLHAQLDELIARIKTLTDIPVAVLTNGSMLWQKDLRRQLLRADLVVPSLDAGDETMFQLVNRPHSQISLDKMLNGLVAFRQEFPGAYWLEVMVVGGYTGIIERSTRTRSDQTEMPRHPWGRPTDGSPGCPLDFRNLSGNNGRDDNKLHRACSRRIFGIRAATPHAPGIIGPCAGP